MDSLAAGKFGAAAIATRRYFLSTVILAAIIVPISIVMFINTAVSNDVRDLLKENDAAAVAVHEQLVNYQSALEQSTRPPASPPIRKKTSEIRPVCRKLCCRLTSSRS